MKKCFICKKKLEKNQEDICGTCFDFFKEKYGFITELHLRALKKLLKKDSKSNKLGRLK